MYSLPVVGFGVVLGVVPGVLLGGLVPGGLLVPGLVFGGLVPGGLLVPGLVFDGLVPWLGLALALEMVLDEVAAFMVEPMSEVVLGGLLPGELLPGELPGVSALPVAPVIIVVGVASMATVDT